MARDLVKAARRVAEETVVRSPAARSPLPAAVLAILALGAAPAAAATGPCTPERDSPRCHLWLGKVQSVSDGDTIDVDIAGDGRGARTVRFAGINAMELRRHSRYPARRRGECHSIEATARLEQLLRRGRMRVRLAARRPASRSGYRLRRQVSVRIAGRWVDTGRVLVEEGHALWLSNHDEWAWNRSYSVATKQGAVWGARLWNSRYCGAGPSPGARLEIELEYDAPGRDFDNVNGEWARIHNRSPAAVPLRGWWFRDSALRRYRFPAAAVIPANGSLLLRMGRGPDRDGVFHWGLPTPPFENPTYDRRNIGDGGYLFDPRGNLRASEIYP
jgi:endonuclease YncB( thermonuclease family)